MPLVHQHHGRVQPASITDFFLEGIHDLLAEIRDELRAARKGGHEAIEEIVAEPAADSAVMPSTPGKKITRRKAK